MAYFRDFGKCLADGCGRPAVCTVFSNRNASHGTYCARCAGFLVKRLNRQEAEEAERLSSSRVG